MKPLYAYKLEKVLFIYFCDTQNIVERGPFPPLASNINALFFSYYPPCYHTNSLLIYNPTHERDRYPNFA